MPTFEETIRPYFETGDFPTQSQFYEMFTKLRWKDQPLVVGDITNLQTILNGLVSTIDAYTSPGGDFVYNVTMGNLLEKILVLPNADAVVSAERQSNPGSEDLIITDTVYTATGGVWVIHLWAAYADVPIVVKGVPAGSKLAFIKRKIS